MANISKNIQSLGMLFLILLTGISGVFAAEGDIADTADKINDQIDQVGSAGESVLLNVLGWSLLFSFIILLILLAASGRNPNFRKAVLAGWGVWALTLIGWLIYGAIRIVVMD